MLEAATEQLLDAFCLPARRPRPCSTPCSARRRRTRRPRSPRSASSVDWDAAAQAHLAALDPPAQQVSWMGPCWARRTPLALDGQLSGVGDMQGRALFEVSWLGSVTADNAGVPPEHFMSWTADPGDVLRLAGTLTWSPTRLHRRCDRARGRNGGGCGVSPCSARRRARTGARRSASSLGGYSDCSSDCMAMLCAGGLKLLWRAGTEASETAGMIGEIVVNASGPAQLNSSATPIAWTADWLGTIRYEHGEEVGVEGRVNAASPDAITN